MAALEQFEDFVREKIVVERCTHKQISNELQQSFPGEKGFSVRSVERFCSNKEISKTCDIGLGRGGQKCSFTGKSKLAC